MVVNRFEQLDSLMALSASKIAENSKMPPTKSYRIPCLGIETSNLSFLILKKPHVPDIKPLWEHRDRNESPLTILEDSVSVPHMQNSRHPLTSPVGTIDEC